MHSGLPQKDILCPDSNQSQKLAQAFVSTVFGWDTESRNRGTIVQNTKLINVSIWCTIIKLQS